MQQSTAWIFLCIFSSITCLGKTWFQQVGPSPVHNDLMCIVTKGFSIHGEDFKTCNPKFQPSKSKVTNFPSLLLTTSSMSSDFYLDI